jgi:porin
MNSLQRISLPALLSIAFMSLPAQLFAQDATNDGTSPRPTDPQNSAASQEPPSPAEVGSTPPSIVGPPPSSTGWYDPALSERLQTMRVKSWGPDGSLAIFGDNLLGNAGGVRSTLADYGIAGIIFVSGVQWQNLLNSPTKTNGSQAYLGQKYTATSVDGIIGTYDMGHIGLTGGQIVVDGGCSVSSYLPAYARGCRFFNLAFNYSLFDRRVDLNVGILDNNFSFVDTYVGGSTQTGSFGPSANLQAQSGLSYEPGSAPGLNVTYHFDSNWYDKIGVQRSVSPQGLVQEYTYYNPHGTTFTEPNAKALVIDEVGFRETATADTLFTYIRGGGLYNWSQYTDFNTRGTDTNWNAYLLADQQLSRPDPGRAYRGWYAGLSVMESPPNVDVFRNYFEARVYNLGPFQSRPGDAFNIVATYSEFSSYARQYYIEQLGLYPPQKNTTSLNMSYAWHVLPGTYLIPGLGFTNHPSFITAAGQGHDLNFFLSFGAYL